MITCLILVDIDVHIYAAWLLSKVAQKALHVLASRPALCECKSVVTVRLQNVVHAEIRAVGCIL